MADYGAAACGGIELWLGKLESFLDGHTVEQARRLLGEHQLAAPVASYQGGLLQSQGEARREHWEHFLRRLDICRALAVKTLVVAADIVAPLSSQDVERLKLSLRQAAEAAAERGVRLALEFQAAAALGNNLETASALVDETGSPHLGICLDAFHFFTGPSKTEDLGYLSTDNLFHVQLCDLAGTCRELAADADRVLPGDGDLPLESIVRRLKEIDYAGCVSVELMNPRIWSISPLNVAEIGITALRKVLALTEPRP